MNYRFLLFFLLFFIKVGGYARTIVPPATDTYWQTALPLEMRKSYIQYGEQFLAQPWSMISDTIFGEFKRKGNRVNYEQRCFAKRRQLAALAMAEIMEGKGRFLYDLKQGVLNLLQEPWWGIPAHYGKAYPSKDDQTVDLFNAETAGMLAWIRYMLSASLGDEMVKNIDHALQMRMLTPARTVNYWWKRGGMNWNPWICSNWLACVLFAEHDEQRRDEALQQIKHAMLAFVNHYPSDGGCDEGTFYWDRAAGSLYDCLSFWEALNQPFPSALKMEKIAAMGSYIYKMYIGNGYCVNFADAHSNHSMVQLNVLYPFAYWLNDPSMRAYAAWIANENHFFTTPAHLFSESGNFPTLGRELILLSLYHELSHEKAHQPLLKQVWLPDLQIMTLRSKANTTKGWFVAMKGGNNGESHNHNDVGSFMVYADGQPLLVDPGVGEYTAETFSAKRYNIWTMQSAYHNLPQINGADQHEGKQFAASDVLPLDNGVSMELATAYPKAAKVKSWKRSLWLEGQKVVVREQYHLDTMLTAPRVFLLTPCVPKVLSDGLIRLGKRMLSVDPADVMITTEDLSPKLDTLLQKVWGNHLYRVVLTIRKQSLHNSIQYTLK